MTKLLSKSQYKNFETGEFVDNLARDYEETLEFIKDYHWPTRAEKVVVDLTNPSITIEGRNYDFLKLAVYYNKKYVLRYFDKSQHLYTKSFTRTEDAIPYIKNLFEQHVFDPADFKKEDTWLQNNLKHFVSKDFRYFVTPRSIRNYLWSTSGINFFFFIVMLSLVLWKGIFATSIVGSIAVLLLLFILGGGIHLLFFLNYFKYVKDKILIMSKGNDIFYFGQLDNPEKFDKKDIFQYSIIKLRGSRNQLNGFAIVELDLKDGRTLKIPNLLVDHFELERKLFEYPRVDVERFPWLRL